MECALLSKSPTILSDATIWYILEFKLNKENLIYNRIIGQDKETNMRAIIQKVTKASVTGELQLRL